MDRIDDRVRRGAAPPAIADKQSFIYQKDRATAYTSTLGTLDHLKF